MRGFSTKKVSGFMQLCGLAMVLFLPCIGNAEQVNYFDLCGPTKEAQFRRWGYKGDAVQRWDIERDKAFSGGFAVRMNLSGGSKDRLTALTWTLPVLYFDRVEIQCSSSQPLACRWSVAFEDGTGALAAFKILPASPDNFSMLSLDLLKDLSLPPEFLKRFPEGMTAEFLKKAGVRLLVLEIKPASANGEEVELLIDRLETFCK